MINVSFNYKPLVQLQLLHEYYKEEKTTDLLLIPCGESATLAKNLGFILKQIDNSLFILSDHEKLISLSDLDMSLKISLFIYSNNPYFYNFTDLPLERPTNLILYFSNNNTADKALHKGSFVTKENYKSVSSIGVPLLKEYATKTPIALVDLYLFELLKNNSNPQSYFIKFPSRKTYWKYAFVPLHRSLEGHAEVVVEEDASLNFLRLKNERLTNQQDAIIFISDRSLPLKQFSDHRVALIQKDKTGKRIELIPLLPMPSIAVVKPESRDEGARVFSEMVVYL